MLTYVCEDVQEGAGFPGAWVTGLVGSRSWTRVLCKSCTCSWPVSHRSSHSPPVCNLVVAPEPRSFSSGDSSPSCGLRHHCLGFFPCLWMSSLGGGIGVLVSLSACFSWWCSKLEPSLELFFPCTIHELQPLPSLNCVKGICFVLKCNKV